MSAMSKVGNSAYASKLGSSAALTVVLYRGSSDLIGCRSPYPSTMQVSEELKETRAEATKAGFRLLNSVVEPAVKRGAANPLTIGPGAIVLETIGRVSGKKRRVPLLASRLCSKVIVTTVRNDSQWVKNVEAEPRVTVWLNGKPRAASGSVARGPLNVVVLDLD